MDNIFEQKRLLSLKIKIARLKIGKKLLLGEITLDDLVGLYQNKNNYGLEQVTTKKEKQLQEIFNCPFLLCDQDCLDWSFKKELPKILSIRYGAELGELRYCYTAGYITKEEYKEQRDLIKYSYYYTSEEGQYILRSGHMKNISEKK